MATYRATRPAFKIAVEAYRGVLSVLQSNQTLVSTRVPLNSGASMPIIGFGTYLIKPEQIYSVLDAALNFGYRNIDTAAMYENEEAIGSALRDLLQKYGLTREDVFITTKLLPEDMGQSKVQGAVARSLCNLGFSYVDLYLIHWPGADNESMSSQENSRLRIESWKELTKLNDKGRGVIRAIGVSNFLAKHLTHIISETRVVPAVNQVEFHPYYNYPDQLYELCAKYNILLQAYASLGGTNNKALVKDPIVNQIAEKHSVTPAQVLLRWALQQGYVIIPKSVAPSKIKLNTELDFELDKEDMIRIYTLEKQEKFSWNPETVA